MDYFKKILNTIQSRLEIRQSFVRSKKGTRSEVYFSDSYVIKINKDIRALESEQKILSSLEFNFAPPIEDFFISDDFAVLVEKKLPGQAIDEVWRKLGESAKDQIVADLAQAVKEIHSLSQEKFWSAKYGHREFSSYAQLLLYRLAEAAAKIKANKKARLLHASVVGNLEFKKVEKVFTKIQPALVHGDLIMHNLLTDGKKLTGILDWEFAQYGDSFYDLARVIYYQECAKAYEEKGKDEFFEYDFTTKLIDELQKSIKFNEEKYEIIRSVYFIDTIIWALNSADPEKNLKKLNPPTLIQLQGKNH